MDKVAIKGAMWSKSITMKDLSKHLGVSEPTLRRRFHKGTLRLDETKKIIDLLEIPRENWDAIFFDTM